ncbi:MAG: hypothetical protein JW798_01475, partial [Prolixibacteraceae bacterium]|nr:hypothetical protein [Prolixibacteraceae bacterium]
SSHMRIYTNIDGSKLNPFTPIQWEGNSIRVEYEYIYGTKTHKGEIKGTLSADGRTINSLSASLEISYPNTVNGGYFLEELQDDVREIPITFYDTRPHFGISQLLQGTLVTTKSVITSVDGDGVVLSTNTKTATEYNEYSYIQVEFGSD